MLNDYIEHLRQINKKLYREGVVLHLNLDVDKSHIFEEVVKLEQYLFFNDVLKTCNSVHIVSNLLNFEEVSLYEFLKEQISTKYEEEWNLRLSKMVEQPEDAGVIDAEIKVISPLEVKLFNDALNLAPQTEVIENINEDSTSSGVSENIIGSSKIPFNFFGANIDGYSNNESTGYEWEDEDEDDDEDYDADDSDFGIEEDFSEDDEELLEDDDDDEDWGDSENGYYEDSSDEDDDDDDWGEQQFDEEDSEEEFDEDEDSEEDDDWGEEEDSYDSDEEDDEEDWGDLEDSYDSEDEEDEEDWGEEEDSYDSDDDDWGDGEDSYDSDEEDDEDWGEMEDSYDSEGGSYEDEDDDEDWGEMEDSYDSDEDEEDKYEDDDDDDIDAYYEDDGYGLSDESESGDLDEEYYDEYSDVNLDLPFKGSTPTMDNTPKVIDVYEPSSADIMADKIKESVNKGIDALINRNRA